MGHGYEQIPVAEIRNLLKEKGVDGDILNQSKRKLVELLLAYNEIPQNKIKKEDVIEEEKDKSIEYTINMDNPLAQDLVMANLGNGNIVYKDNSLYPTVDIDDEENEEEEDELDTLDDTPFSFNNLEVEIEDGEIINVEGLEAIVEQRKVREVVNEVKHSDVEINEVPYIYDVEWSDYIISQLNENEKFNNYPKCIGLRRLLQKYIGPIIKKEVVCNKAPNSGDQSATITVNVQVLVNNPKHPLFKKTIEESSIADANLDNNKDYPYSTHMSPISERRAESRVYRSILNLDVVSAEEMSGGIYEMKSATNDDGITSIQQIAIDKIAERLDINVFDFINCGSSGKKYETLKDIKQDVALKMIEVLNAVIEGKQQLPENIGKYDANWKK